jgi:molybdenum cofactor cytidylyltransferase
MSGRAFAIVPAAGRSARMGQPKLLIDLAGKPLVQHVLEAWQAAGVEWAVVVVRKDDDALAKVVAQAGAHVVQPAVNPPDMKASIGYGLAHIAATYQPQPSDVWLVAPADMPGLSPAIVRHLIAEAGRQPGRILIPTLSGQRGHPVLLPWPLAAAIQGLGEHEGLGHLIAAHNPLLVPCDTVAGSAEKAFADLDTPDDVRRFGGGK